MHWCVDCWYVCVLMYVYREHVCSETCVYISIERRKFKCRSMMRMCIDVVSVSYLYWNMSIFYVVCISIYVYIYIVCMLIYNCMYIDACACVFMHIQHKFTYRNTYTTNKKTMHICVSTCIYISMRICVSAYECMHIRKRVCINIYVCMSVYTFMYVCMHACIWFIHIYIHTCMCTCKHVHIYTYTWVYVCSSVYMYVCTSYSFTYLYTHVKNMRMKCNRMDSVPSFCRL